MNKIENLATAEAFEYLEANGFARSTATGGKLYYFKGDLVVQLDIIRDRVGIHVSDDGEPDQRSPSFRQTTSVVGIGQFTLFDWVLLFHITGVVALKEFAKGAAADLYELFEEAMSSRSVRPVAVPH